MAWLERPVPADGALGHPENAPFDRVIATVGAHEIPAAWLDQLALSGRLGPVSKS